jgi:23S rRNA G2445 N2-methylase RlmL
VTGPPLLRCVARCVHGLEPVVAAELAALPGVVVSGADRRQVLVEVPRAGVPALLGLRTADDVLLLAGEVAGASAGQPVAELAEAVADLDWEPVLAALAAVRPLPERRGLDVVAAVAGVRRWNRFGVEQAVGPLLARRFGARYLERGPQGRVEGRADLGVRLDVSPERVSAALRIGPAPLHRRPWKQDTGPGTLHPPVAAAMARLTGDRLAGTAGGTVLDPFCGDGTVVVEAALLRAATGTSAGVAVRGSDADPQRVANARANAARAGAAVDLAVADALEVTGPVDVLLSNPPWNLAVEASGRLDGGLARFWSRLPDLLAAGGTACLLTEADLDAPAALAAAGRAVGPVHRLRVAGRITDLVLAGRDTAPALPADVEHWATVHGATPAAGWTSPDRPGRPQPGRAASPRRPRP